MPSQAQRDFTYRLDALLQEGLPLFGMEPNAQLGDWLVVISAPYLDDNGDLTSGYSVTFSGNLLDHNAKGLLQKAAELLEDGELHDEAQE